METLSEKELSLIKDGLSEEQLLVKKYQLLAQMTTEPETSTKFREISQRHQEHFNSLYALLG